MNLLFLEYDLTTSLMAQVDCPLEKKVTAEEICPCPRAETNLSISGGQLKEKLRILTLTP